MLAEKSFNVTVNQAWLLFWKLGYLIITLIEGQSLMHTVCRQTKANAFGDLDTTSMKLPVEILNQEKMFALIHTRTIPKKMQLMETWKLEINTSSNQKQRCPFLKTWEHFIQ